MENWKIINEDGIEKNWYAISDLGNVKAIERIVNYSNGISKKFGEKILNQRIVRGIVKVCLQKENSGNVDISVDYLVAKYWVENPNNFKVWEHIDSDNLNNKKNNIRWITVYNNPKYDTVISLEGEFWKSIPEFSNYMISNYGRIKTLPKEYIRKSDRYYLIKRGELLTPQYDKDGYQIIGLVKDGESRASTKRIHRLVCEAFNEHPIGKDIVDHIDRNKSNNIASNLRWVNALENSLNGVSKFIKYTNLKTGESLIFRSLNEASNKINIAPDTIKNRADGITEQEDEILLEWEDSTKNIVKNKEEAKENLLEEISNNLINLNYKIINSNNKKIELKNFPCNILLKNTLNAPTYFNINAGKSIPDIIIWKKCGDSQHESPGTIALIDINIFYDLLKCYKAR